MPEKPIAWIEPDDPTCKAATAALKSAHVEADLRPMVTLLIDLYKASPITF